MIEKQMKKNIILIYGIKMLKGFIFTMSIYYLFFQKFGLGETDLFLVQSIFAISVVILEIPTGFISDKYSRKFSLILGAFFGAIAYLFYSFGDGFGRFAIAEVLMALGYCLISGTDTSVIYDSLKTINNEKKYKNISGKVSSISLFAESVGGVIGGAIASISILYPFYLDTIACILALVLAIMITEPPIDRPDSNETSLAQIIRTIKYSVRHKKIFRLIIFGGVMGCITISTVWLSQPFMEMVKLPIFYFGIFWFASNMLGSVFGLFIHWVEVKIGEVLFPYFVVISCMICLVLIGIFPYIWALPIFFLFQFVRQGNRLISSENLHLITKSEIRATIQSISSMFFRFCFAVFGPIFGFVSEHYSMSTSLFIIAIFLGGFSLFAGYKLQNSNI